ncbi:MAG: hydrogenase expression/formation protein HypE [Armatimonadota bacterium]|nr:hydrogenase expression/formation protein HypE [Armatimonadota bacterium]MDR5702351.1 hydrogenase expression/formation protein HypE [Armatimonadota bacterium]MDR7434888.1 hydrogenase expression/formation protein HypE [Armatimonadota bacterium]
MFECPVPIHEYPTILLAHGGGGRLTQMLIERMFLPAFRNPALEVLHDGAVVEVNGTRLAFTTDSFVVSPLFFPGGDIGTLAVHGTVNDLAMCGARPLALSSSFILEEGLSMETLWRIVQSVERSARRVGVPIVTGDTKVVDRGKGDGVYINTAGLGIVPEGIHLSPLRARPGDVVLINGAIAIHGIAILSVREGLEFETELESDTAPLDDLVARILEVAGEKVHVLRDPTRGGLASALNEIASRAKVGIRLEEGKIPIWEEVRGACEILGLDPLYVANEGKCLAIVAREAAEAVLEAMRRHPLGREAAIIGEVVEDDPGKVILRSRIGGMRVVDMLSGEQLPRIC